MFTKENARQLGSKGGKATVKKHGKEHMSKIGQEGAKVFHERYTYEPYGSYDFAIVHRITRKVVGTLSGDVLRSLTE